MIAIACDHSSVELKEEVKKLLTDRGFIYEDFGTDTTDSCHYPIYGARAARAVASGRCDRGIVICGTVIGMSIVANKVKGIRCSLCRGVINFFSNVEYKEFFIYILLFNSQFNDFMNHRCIACSYSAVSNCNFLFSYGREAGFCCILIPCRS